MDHKKTKAAAKTPNMKFTGRPVYAPASGEKIADPHPVERIQFNGQAIDLPAADVQKRKRLFYHADAALIVRLFPHLYKKVLRRGNK